MKRVLILMLCVLVVGCGRFSYESDSDDRWYCPKCKWNISENAVKCRNCDAEFDHGTLWKPMTSNENDALNPLQQHGKGPRMEPQDMIPGPAAKNPRPQEPRPEPRPEPATDD